MGPETRFSSLLVQSINTYYHNYNDHNGQVSLDITFLLISQGPKTLSSVGSIIHELS